MTHDTHAAPDSSSHNQATWGFEQPLAPDFPSRHSAWGRIGDAMRAATNRNSGFVLDTPPLGAAGATGSTPGGTS